MYLLYLPHAEFVLDDWFQFLFYRTNQARGWSGEIDVIRTLLQNKLYSVFQIFWLDYSVDSLVAWVTGYAPRVMFALALAVHVTNAWLLYRLWVRLRIAPRLAYVAGAFFLLMPLSHGALFWMLNTSYYRFPPVFLLLYFLAAAKTFERGVWSRGPAVRQALLATVVLFTGAAAQFGLLFLGTAWMALCFFPPARWKLAAKVVAINGATVGALMVVYVKWINRIPPSHEQFVARYDLSHDFLVRNSNKFLGHLGGMSGVGAHPYYHVQIAALQLAGATLVVVLVWLVGRRLEPEGASHPPRVALFAAGMAVLGYGPLIYLIGGTLRHYYTISPYVSLMLAAVVWMLPGESRRVPRAAAAMALCAYFAVTTVAEIEQCWAPMSRHMQAVKEGLRRLDLGPGDLVVIPNTPWVIGTAPSFALIPRWGTYMAEVITGVKGVEFWREIVIENGRPRLFNRGVMRDTSLAELTRTHVLVGPAEGPYTVMRYWAEPNGKRLHCLKEVSCVEAPAAVDRNSVYAAKPFEHGNLSHLHY